MNKGFPIFCVLLWTCLAAPCEAQFYISGAEPSLKKFSSIETESFEVIYPRGMDSLGRVYARLLEQTKKPLSTTCGWVPNQSYRKRMPVLLHTDTAYSNGMIVWTPRRMEVETVFDAYQPEPIPWERMLAIHEGRHIAQMQYTNHGPFRTLNLLVGQMGSGALSALYCGPAFFEGDAVAAETGLTSSGRGRTADFLEYYKACFDEGQFRNSWWQWRYGSLSKHTPDHYRAGYLAMAGQRVVAGDGDFVRNYYQRIFDHKGISFRNWDKTVLEDCGAGSRDVWLRTCSYLARQWAEADSLRAPFPELTGMTPFSRHYSDWEGLDMGKDRLYAIRRADAGVSAIYECTGGQWHRKAFIGSMSSSLRYSRATDCVFWSEYKADLRWDFRSTSVIKALNPEGKVRTIVAGRRLYNPAPHPEKSLLAAVEYPQQGRSRLVVFSLSENSETGFPAAREEYSVEYPGQLVECAWGDDGHLYASAIVPEGFTILDADEHFREALAPLPVKMKDLKNSLYFTSDFDGTDELYRLVEGRLLRLSNLKEGGNHFCFFGDRMYFSTLSPKGRYVASCPRMEPVDVSNGRLHRYSLAEGLSEQETVRIDYSDTSALLSSPKKYSKLAHAFNMHSWAPLYVDFDDVASMSFEKVTSAVNLGATGFFQNTTGSLYGYAAAGLPGITAKISYAGLFPVLQATLRSDWSGRRYGELFAYAPLVFHNGALSKGVIPQFSIGTDGYWAAALRMYVMMPTPSLCLYPKAGVGVEGALTPKGLSGRLYGYLPGFRDTDGISFSFVGNQAQQGWQAGVSYALPFGSVDFDRLCPYFYLRNFEFIPMARYTQIRQNSLKTVGGTLNAVLANFLCIPYDTRIGVNVIHNINFAPQSWSVSAVFSIDI